MLFILLYWSEYWSMTGWDMSRLFTFHATSLRKIHRIIGPRKTTDEELVDQSKREDKLILITRRHWR